MNPKSDTKSPTTEDIVAISLLLLSEQRASGANYGKLNYQKAKETYRRTLKNSGSKKKKSSRR